MSTINISVLEKCDRLDRYLSQNLSDLSRSRIQQLIEQGHVQV
ncbi:MAG: S4 domain-containing protein, partial [Dolichospermum sp.]